MPALYIVATPIGNLEDITLRALRILKEVRLIAAEDTRKTRVLLDRYQIRTPLTSYHEHNKAAKTAYLLRHLETGDLALVSEAGMPGISDPGCELVVSAAAAGVKLVPVPGPSALVTALAVSGLPASRFTCLGFLPRRRADKARLLNDVAREPRTLVVFEAPHRLQETLEEMRRVLGERRVVAVREATKLHEEIFRGTVSEAMIHFQQPRGEFTLVIEGRPEEGPPKVTAEVEKQVRALQREGATAREALAQLADATGISRKDLYRAWLAAKDDR